MPHPQHAHLRSRPTAEHGPPPARPRGESRGNGTPLVRAVRANEWCLAVVPLSESFRTTLADLAAQLGADAVEWAPAADRPVPSGAGIILIAAGGVEGSALDLLAELPPSSTPRYVIGSSSEHRVAAACVQRGARDYFALPNDLDLLRRTLEREAREAKGVVNADQFAEVERRDQGFGAILGRSPALERALTEGRRVAMHADVTVLIGGETGTGKELLARAIHYDGPRAAKPFVEINCAAIPSNLLESELFGHERGAFTGALNARPGLFELADGGTVFLDEIGNLPLELQPKLLRALESRSIRRVGGQTVRQVDVRVIAASHIDLAQAVANGSFREDLYYRLNVVMLSLPPLRQREGDVELLAETFVARIARDYRLPVPALTEETRSRLRGHRWPGNVRELRNSIERALVLSPAGTFRADELRLTASPPPNAEGPIPFPADLRTIIRATAEATLALSNGNKSEAARRLDISRPRLQRLLDGEV